MNYQGVLTKMETEFSNPIQYYLVFDNDFINMNQLLNKKLNINFIYILVNDYLCSNSNFIDNKF